MIMHIFTNRDYYSSMSSNSQPISLSSSSGAEDVVLPTSAYAPLVMPMSLATDSYMQSQQFLPASDTEASPLASSGPIHRNRKIRQLQPYEASPVISLPALVILPPESVVPLPPAPHVISSPPPTVYYSQTTTVPLASSPPLASPPTANRIVPVSPHRTTYPKRPSSSDPYVRIETRRHRRTRNQVNARKWSFLLPIMHYWRSQEGAPIARELGESSSTATSRILPVTGDHIHRTIPLFAARMVRYKDRLDSIARILSKFPREHLETIAGEVDSLVIGQLAMETRIEQMDTQLWESMEFIGALCGANTSLEIMAGAMDRELDRISTQNMHLRPALQESQARERARDQTIEAMSAAIRELQHRMDNAPGKP